MEVKLKVNNVEVVLGIETINDIVYNLPNDEEYYDLLHQLALSNISSIREKIADKDCLSKETVEFLLKDKNATVLANIVRSDCAKEYISDKDIDYIMSVESEEVIENIISYIDGYENINQTETIDKIMKLENDYLMLKLANSWDTPKKTLKKLAKHKDPDISKSAKKTLDDC